MARPGEAGVASPLPPPRQGAELDSLMVYNTTISTNEDTAHENILFYWPPTTSLNEQMNRVGLCSAFGSFTTVFDTSKSVEWVSTSHTRYALVQPEPNFWVVAALRREALPVERDDADAAVVDTVSQLLTMAHRVLALTNGTLTLNFTRRYAQEEAANPSQRPRVWRTLAAAHLRTLVEPWASALVADVAAAARDPLAGFTLHDSLEYLSVDASAALRVAAFASRLHNAHPNTVWHSMLTLGDKVAHTTLDRDTTITVLRLVGRLQQRRAAAAAAAAAADAAAAGGAGGGAGGGGGSALAPSLSIFVGATASPSLALPTDDVMTFPDSPMPKTDRGGPGGGGAEKTFWGSFANFIRSATGGGGDAIAADGSGAGGAGPATALRKDVAATAERASTQVAFDTAVVTAHTTPVPCFIGDRQAALITFHLAEFTLACIVDEKFLPPPPPSSGASGDGASSVHRATSEAGAATDEMSERLALVATPDGKGATSGIAGGGDGAAAPVDPAVTAALAAAHRATTAAAKATLLRGVMESVAAILYEEAPLLATVHEAQALSDAWVCHLLDEAGVLYVYRNSVLASRRTSADVALARFKNADQAANGLNRLRHGPLSLSRCDAVSFPAASAARVGGGRWAFVRRTAEREFAVAVDGADLAAACEEAARVERVARVSLE